MPRRRKSPGKEQILVRGVVIATKVTAAKPAKQQTPRATKAKTTKPSAAIPALPAARILRLTQLLALIDYCAVGAMRTVQANTGELGEWRRFALRICHFLRVVLVTVHTQTMVIFSQMGLAKVRDVAVLALCVLEDGRRATT